MHKSLHILPAAMVAAAMASVDPWSHAHGQQALHVSRLAAPVELDGWTDEPAWRAVEPLPVIMYDPVYMGAPTERTEIRVAHDGEHLYAAARLYDADVSGIRSNSLYRDRQSGDDVFGTP